MSKGKRVRITNDSLNSYGTRVLTAGMNVEQYQRNPVLLYMHEHRDTFHLLLLHSDGTRYATMVDELVALEVDATHRYYTVLAQLGAPMPHVDEALEHMLVTGMFNAYFEIIIHDMPLDKANRYLEEMHDFYTAGWMKIMGQQPTS